MSSAAGHFGLDVILVVCTMYNMPCRLRSGLTSNNPAGSVQLDAHRSHGKLKVYAIVRHRTADRLSPTTRHTRVIYTSCLMPARPSRKV